jgi:hypothetical protein
MSNQQDTQAQVIGRIVNALKRVPPIKLSPEQEAALRTGQEQQQRKERQAVEHELALERAAQIAKEPSDIPHILTLEAIDQFFEAKKNARFKDSTDITYRKRLNQFAREFEDLPFDSVVIRERYLKRFDSMSLKYLVAQYNLLYEFYDAIGPHYKFKYNPIADIKSPDASGYKPKPHPLSAKWLPGLVRVVETDFELAALYHELGAGWRPVELRSIEAIDVRRALDKDSPIIDCHSKELRRGET